MRSLFVLATLLILSQGAFAAGQSPSQPNASAGQPPMDPLPLTPGAAAASMNSSVAPSYPLRGALSPGVQSKQIGNQGIMSTSQGHKHGIIARTIGGAVSDAAHASVALVGATIINQSPDLPPEEESNPEWPFLNRKRKALYVINWSDGTQSTISRLPNGSLQIFGGGKFYTLQPTGEGSYAMMGDYGHFATVSPRPGGGFVIMNADGSVKQVVPNETGGFTVQGSHGLTATVVPGPTGKHHIFGNKNFSSGSISSDGF